MARWLMPSNDETDKSDERILAREAEAMKPGITISRSKLEETMVKNHGMTPEQAKAIMDRQVVSCGLDENGDNLGGEIIQSMFDCLSTAQKEIKQTKQAPLN